MALTLYENELLFTVLERFKVQFPMLGGDGGFTTNFTKEGVVLNQTLTATIRKAGTVQDYDATNGYQANGAASTDLLEDVPVTLDRHKHVPVTIDHISQTGSQLDLERAADEIAFDLGKEAVDYCLTLVKGSNFSQSSEYTTANSDYDATENVRGDLNAIGARQNGRFGIVNTDVAATLAVDQRVASGDYHGQLNGGNAFRRFQNVSGFDRIWEYPSLALNNMASNDFTVNAGTDVITTTTAHGLSIGDRVQVSSTVTLPAGLSASTDYFVLTVPSITTMTVSATDGGSVVDITDTGTGTHSMVGFENLTGYFGTREGIIVAASIPKQFANPDAAFRNAVDIETMTDPDTGLTLALLSWVAEGTFDKWKTVTWIYGAKAGRQAGSAGDITDYAGHRLVSA